MSIPDHFISRWVRKALRIFLICLSCSLALTSQLLGTRHTSAAAQRRVTVAGIVRSIDVERRVFTVRVKVDAIITRGGVLESEKEELVTVSFSKETSFLNEVGNKLELGAAALRGDEGGKEGSKGASVVVVTGRMEKESLEAQQVVLRTACDLHVCPRPMRDHANCGATVCTCPGH